MNFPKLFKTKVAADNRAKFDLSSQCITTSDFGKLTPCLAHEVLPGDSFNIDMTSFVRLAALAQPTFGRVNLDARAFFIPTRTIYQQFPQFITQSKYSDGTNHYIPTTVPYFTNKTLVNWFTTSLTISGSSSVFDFQIDSTHSYKFTNLGRHVYNVLLSLGYSINWSESDETPLSALPLLSFIRVIRDWYLNARFDDVTLYDGWFIKYGQSSEISSGDLEDIETLLRKYYDSDYFTSSWKKPNQSGDEISIDPVLFGRTDSSTLAEGTGAYATENGTYTMSTTQRTISNFGIESLQRLHRYLQRNNLVGNRYIDQLLARFGVKIDDTVLNRCTYLGSYQTPISISDVTATASSSNDDITTYLGDVTGKGIGYANGKFSYDAKEHGFILIIYSIYPKAQYYQGRSRMLQHLEPFDFFTPECDSLGVQAIRNDELFSSYLTSSQYSNGQTSGGKPNGVFGYSPRYSEYKCQPRDTLSGDFRVPTLGINMQGYHLMRTLSAPSSTSVLTNTRNFRTLTESEQTNFDRIFYIPTSNYDHFFIFFDFNVTAYRKMKTLGEDLLDEHEKGEIISIRPDATKF